MIPVSTQYQRGINAVSIGNFAWRFIQKVELHVLFGVDTGINETSREHANPLKQTVWALIPVSTRYQHGINRPVCLKIRAKNELQASFGNPRLCKKLYERRWAKNRMMTCNTHVVTRTPSAKCFVIAVLIRVLFSLRSATNSKSIVDVPRPPDSACTAYAHVHELCSSHSGACFCRADDPPNSTVPLLKFLHKSPGPVWTTGPQYNVTRPQSFIPLGPRPPFFKILNA